MSNDTNIKKELLSLFRGLQKKAEQADHYQKQYQILLDNLSDGIVITDEDGIILFANAMAGVFLNMKSSDILGSEFALPADKKKNYEINIRKKSGICGIGELNISELKWDGKASYLITITDITNHKVLAVNKENRIAKLEKAISNAKTLKGLLPICSCCKKIRNADGSWEDIEVYIDKNTAATFSHGICPDCIPMVSPGYTHRKQAHI